MKKKYKKPEIKKVELKPEEAVLAACKTDRVCGRLLRAIECDFGPTVTIGS